MHEVMKTFLKYTLASIVGVLISSILLFFIFLAVIGTIISSGEKEVSINPNSILQIKLDKPIRERTSDNPFENFDLINFKPTMTLGLRDIIHNIHKAKTDPNIEGIYLDLSLLQTGWGTIEEIRNALLDFKSSKKFIISYADYYTNGSYYLASVSDSIFITPQGVIAFIGLRSEVMFFKGTLEKLDLKPEIIRHGKFKSAVEPYMNEKMSDENREQYNLLLSSMWNHILEGISVQRKIDTKELNRMADELVIKNARSAVEHKLIDGVRYKDEILARLTKLSGVKSEKQLEIVNIAKYNKSKDNISSKLKRELSKNKIALIYASGEITMGEGAQETIGSETLSQTIREVRQDSTVKAIVLRINSPGGNALASEIIWRELDLAAKVKPLIVSMGSVAASGGYYIAAPADTILADATTITGSIGVFGVMLNAQDFFKNKLGITTDVVQTNKHANLASIFRPLTPEEKEYIQAEVENTYSTFITHVSAGRKISVEKVDSIGQGRVWSAQDAVKLGLVNMIGGLDKAIEIAAEKAHLKTYGIIELPKAETPLNTLLGEFSAKVRSNIIKSELGNEEAIYSAIKKISNVQGVQTLMPYDIKIY
jgi:protease IV